MDFVIYGDFIKFFLSVKHDQLFIEIRQRKQFSLTPLIKQLSQLAL